MPISKKSYSKEASGVGLRTLADEVSSRHRKEWKKMKKQGGKNEEDVKKFKRVLTRVLARRSRVATSDVLRIELSAGSIIALIYVKDEHSRDALNDLLLDESFSFRVDGTR